MKTIKLIISPQGESSLETKGFRGASCQQASRFLELALGRKTGEQRTAEYYATEKEQQHEQQ